jgi:hypothetical protein
MWGAIIKEKEQRLVVMVRAPTSSVVNSGFQPRSDETKDYKIDICYFSAKRTALRSKSKDWLARNQNNASEWSDMLLDFNVIPGSVWQS